MLVLSDGEDTESTASPATVAGNVQKDGIIVDSVLIGDANQLKLRALSKASGGYVFKVRLTTPPLHGRLALG